MHHLDPIDPEDRAGSGLLQPGALAALPERREAAPASLLAAVLDDVAPPEPRVPMDQPELQRRITVDRERGPAHDGLPRTDPVKTHNERFDNRTVAGIQYPE